MDDLFSFDDNNVDDIIEGDPPEIRTPLDFSGDTISSGETIHGDTEFRAPRAISLDDLDLFYTD